MARELVVNGTRIAEIGHNHQGDVGKAKELFDRAVDTVLAIKCPGGGLPPYELEHVVGRTLLVDLDEEAQLEHAHLGPVGAPVAASETGRH